MAHWTIRCSDEWLMPVYDRIHQELIQKCEILHMDETRIQVNKENGKKASSDSFMWVLQSGACEDIKATFFHYSRTRSQMSDLIYNERKAKRQEASRALLDAFWSWVENTISIPTTNEKLTKALNYSLNNKKELEMFLEDGRLEISNNLCESHIRPFATARRAWLFADTPNGARANAVLYALVETARANDLNVYAYLDYLLAEMPNADFYNHPEIIDDMLPWSDKLPESCRLTHKHKKNFKK